MIDYTIERVRDLDSLGGALGSLLIVGSNNLPRCMPHTCDAFFGIMNEVAGGAYILALAAVKRVDQSEAACQNANGQRWNEICCAFQVSASLTRRCLNRLTAVELARYYRISLRRNLGHVVQAAAPTNQHISTLHSCQDDDDATGSHVRVHFE